MSAPDLLGRDDLPDVLLVFVRSYCTDISVNSSAPADAVPEGFQWYAQDSGDEVSDEVLAWASMDEADCSTGVVSAYEP